MQGNSRRHQHLFAAATASQSTANLPPQSSSRARQQQQADFNGLPAARNQSTQIAASNHHQQEFRAFEARRFAGRHLQGDQVRQQQQQQTSAAESGAQFEGAGRLQQAGRDSHHHHHHHPPTQRGEAGRDRGGDFAAANERRFQPPGEHYASQLRGNHLQHRFQAGQGQLADTSSKQRARAGQDEAERPPACSALASSSSAAASERAPHVNFNRAGQAAGAGQEEGESRKKKYLTAKYGQQQMNLIKKRLKIEMWLYEQLQELSKGSKSEAELDEIDVDLDQLLDLDDDNTRRHWLKKTLAPFEDLPAERIDKFIGEVLEQSKLL